MSRRPSLLERRVRQSLVRNLVGPFGLRSLKRLVTIADTRVRRSLPVDRYCSGQGIEIGAAASPAIVPLGASVKYVDKYPLEEIQADPELQGLPVVPPDIVCSAERLEAVGDVSQDFVLAFSLLEHVQDPIRALESFVRVTKPGGTVILTVPDKRKYGPDKRRPVTTYDHLLRDYREGPAWSLEAHLRESALLGKRMTPEEAEVFVREKVASGGHTHFHVWTPDSFLDFVLRSRTEASLSFELLEFAQYGHETQCVLRVN